MLARTALMSMAVAGAALHAPAARADLLAACAPEVERFCADVVRGRGRVTACLAAHPDQLGPGCGPQVRAAAQGPLMPGDARRILDPGFRADLPQACAAAAARYCPSVPPGDARVFACLYARLDRVDAACSAAAQAVVRR